MDSFAGAGDGPGSAPAPNGGSAGCASSSNQTVLPSLCGTVPDLQAQINSLLATISSLQSQLSATTGGTAVSTGYTFNTNLTIGSKGADVMNLQKALNMSAD